jgi:hypothetical protein
MFYKLCEATKLENLMNKELQNAVLEFLEGSHGNTYVENS